MAAELEKVEMDYDYCLIDCHLDFSFMTQITFFAADLVIVPILLDGFSRDNLNIVRNHIEKIECIINDYSGREGLDIPYCVIANRVANRKSQKEVYRDIMMKHDILF